MSLGILLMAGFFTLTPPEAKISSLVRPSGEPMFMSAVEHLYRPYPEQWRESGWAEAVISNLQKWGFNAMGPGPSQELRGRGLPYTLILWLAEPMTTSSDPDDYIYPTQYHQPCTGFPNVFSPKWKTRLAEAVQRQCGKLLADKDLIGYYLDNELRWWGEGHFGNNDNGLFHAIAKLPESHSAHQALVAFLSARNTDIASASESIRREFVEEVCDRFFKDTCAAIRAVDPNHLILGVRFAGLGGPDEAWKACGQYCDVVSFNVYPWVDLRRGFIADSGPGEIDNPLRSMVEARWRRANCRPMIVSEWATVAFDSGLSCAAGAGQRFPTQRERTIAAEAILREFASWPFLVGASWYRYLDNRLMNSGDEDCNYGLTDAGGVAYPELTSMFARVNPTLNELRGKKYQIPPINSLDTRYQLATEHADQALVIPFTQSNKSFSAGHINLVQGGRQTFDAVYWKELPMGALSVMVSVDGVAERRMWVGSRRAFGHQIAPDGGIIVTNLLERDRAKLRVVTKHHVTTQGKLQSQLLSVENLGNTPVTLNSFYFQLYSPFAVEGSSENARVNPRNVWKPFPASAWIGTNGVFAGAISFAPNAKQFCFWSNKNNPKELHPDASFAFNSHDPEAGVTLQPNAYWQARGCIWLEWCFGKGGAGEWNRLRGQAEYQRDRGHHFAHRLQFPWRSETNALANVRGHIQGIAVADDWLAVSTENTITTLDWSGRKLHQTTADRHIGDLYYHQGLLYAAVTKVDVARGWIAVYNRELKLLREVELPVKGSVDGIAYLDGALYVGVDRQGKTPHATFTMIKVDPFSMKILAEREISLPFDIHYGPQNITTSGGRLYVSLYPVDSNVSGCVILSNQLEMLGMLELAAGHGFERAPARFDGDRPRFIKAISDFDWQKTYAPSNTVVPKVMLRLYEQQDGGKMRHLSGSF